MKAAIATIAVIWLALASMASAQQVISAKSGLINYTMGKVVLDGKDVELKFGNFPQIKANAVLETQDGRAEVLLSPGVFLRVGEESAVRMLSDRLTDTKLELLRGSILIECADLIKGDEVTVVQKDANIALLKNGVYRMDSDPAQLRVYDGEAQVSQGGQVQAVKKARLLALNGVSVAEKFDTKTGDSLFRWARRRAESLAYANVSAAKLARDRGVSGNSWFWNPWFGMYTYLPYRGIYHSFWGYQFWSPVTVYAIYAPPPVWRGGDSNAGLGTYNPNVGYSQVGHTSAGTSGTVAASAPPTAASSAPSAPVSRDTGNAGGQRR